LPEVLTGGQVSTLDAAPGERQTPQHDFSSLTANSKGEGTYQINTSDGQTVAVPYSNVPVFTENLRGSSFASPDEQERFEKDAAADPHRPTFWNALTNPVGSGGTEMGPVGWVQQAGGTGINASVQSVAHPIDTAKGIAKTAAYVGGNLVGAPVPQEWNPVDGIIQQYQNDRQAGGDALATANLAGNIAAMIEGGRAMGAAARPLVSAATRGIGTGLQGVLAGDMNAPIVGSETDLTPAVRYASMKNMGLQPNAAEATNSTPLNRVETYNQNSLTAQPTYNAARAANLKALNRFTVRLLDDLTPAGPEEGGAAVQQGMLKSHADLKAAATEAYKDLDAQVGDQPLPGAAGLRQQAQAILDENAPYYKLHPELEPTKAMAIVRDLAGAKAPARPGPAVITGFGPVAPAVEAAPPEVPTYSEFHRLRSDLLDFNNTNPDLVKNQANGWISQLAGAADSAITSGENALTPKQLETFRNANDAWKFMKDTYDNPSHPFYSAVRTPSPSMLVNGTSGIARTPEMLKALQTSLGPEGIGPVQRGVAEKLLGTTKEGGYNFKTFQGQWNKLKPDIRDALFTPEQQQQFADIGNAGTVLHEDVNPSGTAKLGQDQWEMMGGMGTTGAAATGHPLRLASTAAYHAAQYAVGKLMNSPTFVDWLMRDQGIPTSAGSTPGWELPASAVAGAISSRGGSGGDPHVGPSGQPNFYSDAYLRSKAAFDAARSK
jgi:hypothetical protein